MRWSRRATRPTSHGVRLLARPRRRLDNDAVERMALTTTLELDPIDDGVGKLEDLRLRQQAKRIVGSHSCFKLRTSRSRRARAGIFLWLCGLRHGCHDTIDSGPIV